MQRQMGCRQIPETCHASRYQAPSPSQGIVACWACALLPPEPVRHNTAWQVISSRENAVATRTDTNSTLKRISSRERNSSWAKKLISKISCARFPEHGGETLSKRLVGPTKLSKKRGVCVASKSLGYNSGGGQHVLLYALTLSITALSGESFGITCSSWIESSWKAKF